MTIIEPLEPDSPPSADVIGVLLATDDDAWRRQARCRDLAGTLTGLFFSDDLVDIARAKAICSKCAVSAECLESALTRKEPWGVWGGELLENGRVVVDKRPRGRPPKNPRPPLVVDEVPLPPPRVACRAS
jgi:WhiB family redox-sensing transcriptional regulator